MGADELDDLAGVVRDVEEGESLSATVPWASRVSWIQSSSPAQ